jgi:hypothetical protein
MCNEINSVAKIKILGGVEGEPGFPSIKFVLIFPIQKTLCIS